MASASCLPPPANMVSWWQGENKPADLVGGNTAVLMQTASYSYGEVGSGFLLNGLGDYLRVPASSNLDVGQGPGLTLEAWVNPTDTGNGHSTFEWALPTGTPPYGVHLWIGHPSHAPGYFFANIVDTNGGFHVIEAPEGTIQPNYFQHIAVTYDKASGVARLFLNGNPVAESWLGTFTPQTRFDLNLGCRPAGSSQSYPYAGVIDEATVYARALDPVEVQAIAAAGSEGKCAAPPYPPAIIAEPSARFGYVGDTISFVVRAAGTAPLTYYWYDNYGRVLPGTGTATLTLTNVQLDQGGQYSVLVSNQLGTAFSQGAPLTVVPQPSCVPPATGLIGLWRLDGDTQDALGFNNGSLVIGGSYSQGFVREALTLNGTNQYVQVADAAILSPTRGLTLEGWVMLSSSATDRAMTLIAKDDESFSRQYLLGTIPSSANIVIHGSLRVGTSNVNLIGSRPLAAGVWNHLAATYDGAAWRLYVNGTLDTNAAAGGAIAKTTTPLRLGRAGTSSSLEGSLDEVGLYGRALAGTEIQAIYNAGAGGKCRAPVAPFVLTHPVAQTNTVGGNTTFLCLAAGSFPLSYQWSVNGANLPGATANTLVLTNVQIRNAGVYSVTVSNAAGASTSSNASLTVVYPPAVVRLPSTNVSSGAVFALPVLLTANGNENAIGFSLAYDATKLTYLGTGPGSGTGAMIVSNTSQTNSGKVGLAIVLPPGTTYTAGTQVLAQVCFAAPVQLSTVSTAIGFGDQPTVRQLLDDHLSLQSATYSGNTVSIAMAEYEGDLFPLPAGDHSQTLADWLVVGRYAARLDYPTNAAQFQRADCAPRATLGDGAITVCDWVQSGRYVFGWDPWTLLGGPTNELAISGAGPSASRIVSVSSATLSPQQVCNVAVSLAAQGNENALGLSLSFDPARAAYIGAALAPGAGGATLYENASQASAGQVGFVLALPTGSSFSQGKKEVITLSFVAGPAASGSFAPTFADLPVPREVSDAAATALAASYSVNVPLPVQPPALRIASGGGTVSLAWPLWAANFTLQETSAGLPPSANWTNVMAAPETNDNERVLTLPRDSGTKFYRLIQQ